MDRRRLDLVKVKLVPVAHLTLVTILGYVQQVDNESKTQQVTYHLQMKFYPAANYHDKGLDFRIFCVWNPFHSID